MAGWRGGAVAGCGGLADGVLSRRLAARRCPPLLRLSAAARPRPAPDHFKKSGTSSSSSSSKTTLRRLVVAASNMRAAAL